MPGVGTQPLPDPKRRDSACLEVPRARSRAPGNFASQRRGPRALRHRARRGQSRKERLDQTIPHQLAGRTPHRPQQRVHLRSTTGNKPGGTWVIRETEGPKRVAVNMPKKKATRGLDGSM